MYDIAVPVTDISVTITLVVESLVCMNISGMTFFVYSSLPYHVFSIL